MTSTFPQQQHATAAMLPPPPEVITHQMSTTELKEEAHSRFIHQGCHIPDDRHDLLALLVLGTPCLTKTELWREVLRFRARIQAEVDAAVAIRKQQQLYYHEHPNPWGAGADANARSDHAQAQHGLEPPPQEHSPWEQQELHPDAGVSMKQEPHWEQPPSAEVGQQYGTQTNIEDTKQPYVDFSGGQGQKVAAAKHATDDYDERHPPTQKRQEYTRGLSLLWDTRFAELVEFKRMHGDCDVPYTFESNPQLSTWVRKQRYMLKLSRLTQERHRQLQEIGFIFAKTKIKSFDDMYQELVEYAKTHGTASVKNHDPDHPALGIWVKEQRKKFHNNKLTHEQIALLIKIGFEFCIKGKNKPLGMADYERKRFEAGYAKLCAYVETHGNADVPFSWSGNWVGRVRRDFKQGKLSQEQIDRLVGVGFEFSKHEVKSWAERYNELVTYKTEHDGKVIVRHTDAQHRSLYYWMCDQRKSHREKKLTEERVTLLREIGLFKT